MQQQGSLFVYTSDLRTEDHRGLDLAHQKGKVLPLYIHDQTGKWRRPLGAAARWWLHFSLKSLASRIEQEGSRLLLRQGDMVAVLQELCQHFNVKHVVLSRSHDTYGLNLQKELPGALQSLGVTVDWVFDHTLHEPGSVATQGGGTYKVFTPFWRALSAMPMPEPTGTSVKRQWLKVPRQPGEISLEELGLLPQINWDKAFYAEWSPGEVGAKQALKDFIETTLAQYEAARDVPSLRGTSRLSPHFAFGEIHPRRIWHELLTAFRVAEFKRLGATPQAFLRQIAWRDFAFHTLNDAPDLATVAIKKEFDAFPWETNQEWLHAWQRGATGYPIVDAGMRELWHTGWMHNRVRMIVGSFLVKHLRLDWRHGEQWFWDTLVDACPANNAQNWQWIAGCGRDAAPYFRIFNPTLQSEKFDPEGIYMRRWVPELTKSCYVKPLVQHQQARILALNAYQKLRHGVPSV